MGWTGWWPGLGVELDISCFTRKDANSLSFQTSPSLPIPNLIRTKFIPCKYAYKKQRTSILFLWWWGPYKSYLWWLKGV